MKLRSVALPTIIELVCHLLFWTVAITLALNSTLTTDLQVGDSLNSSRFHYRMPINVFVFYTNYFVLVPALRSQSLRYRAAFSLLLVALAAGLEALLDISDRLTMPLAELFPILVELFTINVIIQAVYWLISTLFRRSHDRAADLRRNRELLEKNAQMELALLKSQLNPHFLFNVLNTLYISAYEHGDKPTADGISKLSDLLRYFLYESTDQRVPVESEVECLRNYIELQKMRFLDDVSVNLRIDGDYGERKVAPFLFITLLENAYKHGVGPGERSEIDVSIALSPGRLIFEVVNDVAAAEEGNANGKEPGGLGLENLRRRLELLYPKRHSLSHTASDARYTARLELRWQ